MTLGEPWDKELRRRQYTDAAAALEIALLRLTDCARGREHLRPLELATTMTEGAKDIMLQLLDLVDR